MDALCLVQAKASESLAWAKEEEREEFEGWMTCTYEQAIRYVRTKTEQDEADRLTAARIIGMG